MVHIENRNLYRLTRFVLLKVSLVFGFFAKFRKAEKRLLIIKTDAIGDYILFRNFIEVLKRSSRYKDYQVDLLSNPLLHEFIVKYDAGFINETIFITPLSLYEAPLKTLKLGWLLFKKNYEVVINPSYTRTLIIDGIAALTAAKEIIGFNGDTELIYQKYKKRTDEFYTRKLLLPPNIYFEFDRNKFFFESILDQSINLFAPYIEIKTSDKKGIIIFPGANVFRRRWEAGKFLALIKLILQNTSQPVYLAGGPSELQIGNYITENLPPKSVDNLIGKTSIIQMIALIGNADLIIANETSAIHIAAATQTKAICILGGGHFGRFAPYPKHLEDKPLCVYEKMECYYCNWNCKFHIKENEAYPCISNISLEKVWMETLQLLSIV